MEKRRVEVYCIMIDYMCGVYFEAEGRESWNSLLMSESWITFGFLYPIPSFLLLLSIRSSVYLSLDNQPPATETC